MPTQRTRIVTLSDPVLDALCVEEMLLVAIEPSDELLVFEVFPADDTLLLPMIESSPILKLADSSEHKCLIVHILKPVNVDEHVVLYNLLHYEQAVQYN